MLAFSNDYYGLNFRAKQSVELFCAYGEKINPQEIENYLCECAGVKEAVVVGVKDELLGERICAFVIPDKMKQITDGAELKKNLEVKGIARYKLPDQILLIDSFPVTPVNKIDKAMLRNLASKQKGR